MSEDAPQIVQCDALATDVLKAVACAEARLDDGDTGAETAALIDRARQKLAQLEQSVDDCADGELTLGLLQRTAALCVMVTGVIADHGRLEGLQAQTATSLRPHR